MAGGSLASRDRDRFLAGDPLRALAAIGVLVFHVANSVAGAQDRTSAFGAAYGRPWGHLLQGGRLGVSLFFVLSGYLLSRPYLRALILGAPAPSLARYARNRALRIVPAFWVVAALTLAWFGAHGAGPLKVAAIFGFAQTVDPSAAATRLSQAWTLDVEASFYVLLPLAAGAIALATRNRPAFGRKLGLLAALLLVVGCASLWLYSAVVNDPRAFLTLPPWLFAFVPGIALAAIEIAIAGRLRGRLWASVAPFTCVAGVAVMFAWGAREGLTPLAQALAASGGATLIIASALAVQWSGRGCWRIIDNRPLQLLGRWSYGIYLVQVPLIFALLPGLATAQRPTVRLAIALPLVLSSTLLAAAASYYLVERPALRLRVRDGALPATAQVPSLARETV